MNIEEFRTILKEALIDFNDLGNMIIVYGKENKDNTITINELFDLYLNENREMVFNNSVFSFFCNGTEIFRVKSKDIKLIDIFL